MRYWPSNDDGEPPPMLYEAGSGPGEAPILFENARGACMILNLAESGEPCGGAIGNFLITFTNSFKCPCYLCQFHLVVMLFELSLLLHTLVQILINAVIAIQ